MENIELEHTDVVVGNKKAKRVTIGSAIFILCLSLLFFIITFIEYDERPVNQIILLVIAGAGCLLAAFLIMLSWKKSRTIFHRDKVQEIKLIKTYAYHYSDIAGYRQRVEDGSKVLSLIPKDEKLKIIEISPKYSEIKNETLDWIHNSFSDLDAIDYENEIKEIEKNYEFGISKEDRTEKLKQAKKISRILNISTFILCFWVMLWPQPYRLAIWTMIILPFIGHFFIKYFRGLIKYDTSGEKVYPDLALVIFMPGAVLALRAMIDHTLLDWDNFWIPFVSITLALILLIHFNSRKIIKRAWKNVDLLIICAVYSFGATITINWLLADDFSSNYNAEVLEKSISKGNHTTYHFKLTPWELNPEIEEERVYRDVYESYEVGDTVMIIVGTGLFHITWYDIE